MIKMRVLVKTILGKIFFVCKQQFIDEKSFAKKKSFVTIVTTVILSLLSLPSLSSLL